MFCFFFYRRRDATTRHDTTRHDTEREDEEEEEEEEEEREKSFCFFVFLFSTRRDATTRHDTTLNERTNKRKKKEERKNPLNPDPRTREAASLANAVALPVAVHKTPTPTKVLFENLTM